QDALCETAGPAAHGARLRPTGRRDPGPHRCPERLHRARHTRHGSCGISLSGERGTSAFSRFVQQSPVAIKGIHRLFDLSPREKAPRLDLCGKTHRCGLPMTAIAISVDNHARCTALTVEHMIDAETKKCRILIGDE